MILKNFFIALTTWLKFLWREIPYKKEGIFFVLGSIFTYYMGHLSDKKLDEKELREKKNLYIDSYFKDLNQRYFWFDKLVDDDGVSGNGKIIDNEISEYSLKLEQARTMVKVDSFFNASQFRRYFENNSYHDTIESINSALDEAIQFAEAKKHNENTLRNDQVEILKRINGIEKRIYDDIDKH